MHTLRAVLVTLLAAVLGAGAVQELVVRGIRGGEAQPLLVGGAGVVVCALAVVAALSLRRRANGAPRLAAVAGGVAIAFHLLAALPPERNVGLLALLLGVAMGVLLLTGAPAARRRPAQSGSARGGSVVAT